MDGVDQGIEQGLVTEKPGMADLRDITSTALREPIRGLNDVRNKPLKQGWVDGMIASLEKPQEGDVARITGTTDASLGYPPNREFVIDWSSNLGVDLETVERQVREQKRFAEVPFSEVGRPREEGTVRVMDENNRPIYLAIRSNKIDGLQLLFDGSAINNPSHTDKTVRPIIVLSTL